MMINKMSVEYVLASRTQLKIVLLTHLFTNMCKVHHKANCTTFVKIACNGGIFVFRTFLSFWPQWEPNVSFLPGKHFGCIFQGIAQ